jgi:hypothetical protein
MAAGSQTMILPDIFAQVGDLTFDQLSSLRHRGAFSTVSLTFARCCQLTQILSSVPQGLLGKWYQVSDWQSIVAFVLTWR